jgi:serine protease Do
MTKSRLFVALAIAMALTVPALIIPLATSPPAVAGEATGRDFSDLAAKVTPAVVNVAVTMKAGSSDDELRLSGRSLDP